MQWGIRVSEWEHPQVRIPPGVFYKDTWPWLHSIRAGKINHYPIYNSVWNMETLEGEEETHFRAPWGGFTIRGSMIWPIAGMDHWQVSVCIMDVIMLKGEKKGHRAPWDRHRGRSGCWLCSYFRGARMWQYIPWLGPSPLSLSLVLCSPSFDLNWNIIAWGEGQGLLGFICFLLSLQAHL